MTNFIKFQLIQVKYAAMVFKFIHECHKYSEWLGRFVWGASGQMFYPLTMEAKIIIKNYMWNFEICNV